MSMPPDASPRTRSGCSATTTRWSGRRATIWSPAPSGAVLRNADLLALDEMLQFRSYMNEGGKVLFAGDSAGEQYTNNVGDQLYDPKGEIACESTPPRASIRGAACHVGFVRRW